MKETLWKSNLNFVKDIPMLRGGADKSLAQSGRKKATVTKLRIYSTYSPRTSIHFLAHCSNFCKPLKKISEGCPFNQVSGAAITSASDEKWLPFNCFFQSREHVVVQRGQIWRIGWVIKTLEAQVGEFLLDCKCLVSRGIVVQEQDPCSDLSAAFFFQNVLQLHHGSHQKNSKSCSDNWNRWCFWCAFRPFRTHFAESFGISKSSWMMDPTHSCEMPSSSAIDLAEVQRSSKISSWICSIISGVLTVLGCPGRGASQVEKSPCLNCSTQFLTVAYDDACSPNVSIRMAWISFRALTCRKKKTLDDSSCLHVVEIARVAWHASFQPL